ncbi:MAG: hypothetical protein PHE29_13030 [Tissierellia bacterium]|nr:hypothetical protein [Tissierellia bacterium]
MLTPQYLDKISNELFEKHSLAALVILIDAGDELDIYYNNILYGITWLNGILQLSSTKIEEIQTFKNTTDLVINGTIENRPFIDIWDEIVLNDLF